MREACSVAGRAVISNLGQRSLFFFPAFSWWIRMVAVALQSAVEFSLQMPGNAAMFAVVAGIALHDSRPV
jgi:hypothetical protein